MYEASFGEKMRRELNPKLAPMIKRSCEIQWLFPKLSESFIPPQVLFTEISPAENFVYPHFQCRLAVF